jgi:hypothetical protein
MAAAIILGIGAFFVFGIVQKVIRERGLSNWPPHVAFRASQRDPPMLKLNDRLLVDERVQALVGATRHADEGDSTAAHSGDVERLYEALDE